MMKSNTILGVSVYVFLFYLTWCLFAIGFSVNSLRNAIHEKDVDMLFVYLDIDRISDSLKQQIKSIMLDKASEYNQHTSDEKNLGVRETSLALTLSEELIDFYLTKKGITEFFDRVAVAEQQDKPSGEKRLTGFYSEIKSSRLLQINQFRIRNPVSFEISGVDSDNKVYRFVFTLRYFRWVLTDIILNPDDINQATLIEFIQSFQ